MKQIIFSCGCGDTDRFAEDAYRLLGIGDEIPPIYHTTDNIQSSQAKQVCDALVRNQKRFAYYLAFDVDTVEAWDLIKGRRVM